MKILFIGSLPPPIGGDAIWAQMIVEELSNKDIRLRIINTSILGTRAKTLSYSINFVDELLRTFNIWFKSILTTLLFRQDIVHLNSNCSQRGIFRDFFTICFSRFFGASLILHCHSNIGDSIGLSKYSKYILLLCFKFSSKIIVLNKNSAEYCLRIGCKDVFLLPNCIEDSYIISRAKINFKIKKILFTGHIKISKGVLEIISVANKYPDFEFILAGKLSNEIDGVVIPRNVILLGEVEHAQLGRLYKDADIFLFPTYSEGFSISLLEAMANGLPIITTCVGGNADMIESSGGIIVPVANINSICSAIDQLRDYNLRIKISNWNLVKVRENYSLSVVINILYGEYKKLIPNTHV
jgi:glycosyltransferase involved in cell wall biosynthesis